MEHNPNEIRMSERDYREMVDAHRALHGRNNLKKPDSEEPIEVTFKFSGVPIFPDPWWMKDETVRFIYKEKCP